jgi:hypothetical protein
MSNRIIKFFPHYYQVVLALLVTTCFTSLIFLWSKGYLDGTHTSSIYEANQVITSLKEENAIKGIQNSVAKGEVNRAIKKFESFESKYNKLNRIIPVKSFEKLEQGSIRVKDSFGKLLSISNTEDAFRVFRGKVKDFESFVKGNNWKTLTRISSRILTRLNSKNSMTKNMDRTLTRIKRDIILMRRVTLDSVLTSGEKQRIVSKLGSIKVEYELLQNFSEKRKGFDQIFKGYKKTYEAWLKEMKPELTIQKVEADRYGYYFLYLLVGLILLSSVMMLIGHLLQKKYESRLQKDFEDKLIRINEQSLIDNKELGAEYSYEFKTKYSKLQNYIRKRMMFGTIFQEAVPFPSLLMDKNLKVVWANDYFCNIWSLNKDEINNEQVTWDFLAKNTNLGENDPILEGIRNDIAGIYQIQVKSESAQKFEPYEIYVSPVNYRGEKTVQVFFYSLSSLQDAIESQGHSIVGPVMRTIEALVNGTFDFEFQESIKTDFQVAGIEHIYQSFLKFNDYVTLQREGLLDEIDRLEDNISDLRKTIYDIVELNSDVAQNNLELVKDLTNVRNKIISMASVIDKYKANNQKMRSLLEGNIQNYGQSIKKNANLFNSFEEGLKAVPSVDKFKEDLKVIKGELLSFKNRMNQSVDKFINSTTINMGDEISYKQSALADRIQHDLTTFSETVTNLEKKLVFMDVQFTKSQMIFDEHKKTVLDNKVTSEKKDIQVIADEFRTSSRIMSELEKETEIIEGELVQKLRSIYEAYRVNTKNATMVKKLVDDKINEELDEEVYKRDPEASV